MSTKLRLRDIMSAVCHLKNPRGVTKVDIARYIQSRHGLDAKAKNWTVLQKAVAQGFLVTKGHKFYPIAGAVSAGVSAISEMRHRSRRRRSRRRHRRHSIMMARRGRRRSRPRRRRGRRHADDDMIMYRRRRRSTRRRRRGRRHAVDTDKIVKDDLNKSKKILL